MLQTSNINIQELPLQKFYAALKENGFYVTPHRVIQANKILLQYACIIKNEFEICKFLTPVFACSEEEQELFKKIFNRFFTSPVEATEPQQRTKKNIKTFIKNHWKKLILFYILAALVVLIIIFRTAIAKKDVYDAYSVNVSIADKNNDVGIVGTYASFRLITGEALKPEIITRHKDKTVPLQTYTTYDWGDGSEKNSFPSHNYKNTGEYKLRALVRVIYNADTIKRVLIMRKVFVCPGYSKMVIGASKNTNNIYVNEPITFTASYKYSDGEQQKKLKWLVDGVDYGNGQTIEVTFKNKGGHTISCFVTDTKKLTYCDAQKDLSIHVTEKPVAAKNINVPVIDSGVAAASEVSETDLSFLSRLYKILLALFSVLGVLFAALWLKELNFSGTAKATAMKRYKKLSNALNAATKKEVLPFRNKNYVAATDPDIVEIAKQLRKRVSDNISFLHINKTIQRTIDLHGFFTPVLEARTRPAEYLLVIEEATDNSVQVKLFEYLTFLLKKQGLITDVYYYQKARYYNFYESNGIELQKLFNKHQHHIYIFLGTGQHFTQADTVVLHQWQHKVVITPNSYASWGTIEKSILSAEIAIVPADVQGLTVLADIITDKEKTLNITARLNLNKGIFYKTSQTNFKDIKQLMLYCNNVPGTIITTESGVISIFFEWVAALAIYPVLRWEIILAIGKTIFERYGKEMLLNYTMLLRLVRISWISKGEVPEKLRLELLKNIKKENEIAARETILGLLKEISKDETPQESSTYAEKEIQQIINEFSLHAYNTVYYSSYYQSKHLFKKLLENKQLNDKPMEAYLKNPERQWETPLSKSNNKGVTNYKTGVVEFLRSSEKEETLLGKVYLSMAIISAVVAITSLFALRVLYVWNNYL